MAESGEVRVERLFNLIQKELNDKKSLLHINKEAKFIQNMLAEKLIKLDANKYELIIKSIILNTGNRDLVKKLLDRDCSYYLSFALEFSDQYYLPYLINNISKQPDILKSSDNHIEKFKTILLSHIEYVNYKACKLLLDIDAKKHQDFIFTLISKYKYYDLVRFLFDYEEIEIEKIINFVLCTAPHLSRAK